MRCGMTFMLFPRELQLDWCLVYRLRFITSPCCQCGSWRPHHRASHPALASRAANENIKTELTLTGWAVLSNTPLISSAGLRGCEVVPSGLPLQWLLIVGTNFQSVFVRYFLWCEPITRINDSPQHSPGDTHWHCYNTHSRQHHSKVTMRFIQTNPLWFVWAFDKFSHSRE